MYQVLLGAAIFSLSNITSRTKNEGIRRRLKPPIDAISDLIKEIRNGTNASLWFESGATYENRLVTWKDEDIDIDISQGCYSQIIWDTIQAKPFRDKCSMTITRQLRERREHILRNFCVQLENLGSTLAEFTQPSVKIFDAIYDPPSAAIRDLPEIAAWMLEESLTQSRARAFSSPNLDYYSNGAGANEAIFDIYLRSEVTKKHLRNNSWLKGIVALSLHFQTPSGPVDAKATGWLMSDDTVVTAGHCVYDERYGCLTSVVVMSGYGLPKMKTEFRQGVFAAAHWRWYKTFETEHDLAFIKLDKPFKKAVTIPWTLTPAGKQVIKLAGYPADMEVGKVYMAEGEAMYNPTAEKKGRYDNMLTHMVDTYGGNSGGPVIDSQGNAIAVHCAGDKESNLATAISNESNNFGTIHRLIKQVPPNRERDKGVRWYGIGTAYNGRVVTRFQLWDGYE
ncbi:trypsin-like cysteine/serine peptidase domain-containing protein [Xylaria flabelliformis]|nr:trypsin-like cysteine/serine peptidase domain-containing protein [Xylaria flabelliformis]